MRNQDDDWVAALAATGWSPRELWLECFALGINATPTELRHYLEGDAQLSDAEHNVIAQALNERLHDLGFDRPVPYRTPFSPPA
jgi:hypothetical protein